MYTINDFTDELIRRNFYAYELQKVVKDENTLWYVAKKIRKRKTNLYMTVNSDKSIKYFLNNKPYWFFSHQCL